MSIQPIELSESNQFNCFNRIKHSSASQRGDGMPRSVAIVALRLIRSLYIRKGVRKGVPPKGVRKRCS